jgi:phosphatidylinositol 4-kinase
MAGLTDFESVAAGGVSDLDEALATSRDGGAAAGIGSSPLVSPARGRGVSDVGSVGGTAAGEGSGVAATPVIATVAFRQRWKDKAARIRALSPYGHHPGWRLVPVIIKSHDDLRQEQFASQLLQQMAAIWKAAATPVWLRPYDILSTDEDGGVIEAVPDTVSLHALKEKDDTFTSLDDWFMRYFHRGKHAGKRDSLARQNFARSLAAYSIACYVLQIKDRHNGNILLDANGHVIHIDFGFLFTSSPGGNMNFESAPWKLTADFVGVLGGKDSRLFKYYRSLCVRAFTALRKSAAKITLLVEMTLAGNSHLPCFQKGSQAVLTELAERFVPHLKSDSAVAAHVNGLVDASASAFSTSMYDAFQYYSLGIR